MFSLEVATLFLLFGALAHCQQQPACIRESSKEESCGFHKRTLECIICMCVTCVCLHLLEKGDCPIDIYFTIDTSETIALQEPPPGALVESIKVPWFLISRSVLKFCRTDASEQCLPMLHNVWCVAGFHQAVCAAFGWRRVQRSHQHQVEHRWASLLSNTENL